MIKIQWLSQDSGSGIAAVICTEEVKGIGLVILCKELLSMIIKECAVGIVELLSTRKVHVVVQWEPLDWSKCRCFSGSFCNPASERC